MQLLKGYKPTILAGLFSFMAMAVTALAGNDTERLADLTIIRLAELPTALGRCTLSPHLSDQYGENSLYRLTAAVKQSRINDRPNPLCTHIQKETTFRHPCARETTTQAALP
jgi:hypothetical protein